MHLLAPSHGTTARRRPRRAWLAAAALLAALAPLAASPRAQDGPERGAAAEARVVHIDLALDLRRAPDLEAVATLSGDGAPERVEFLLNRALRVERVSEDDVVLAHREAGRLRSLYHREGRLVRVERRAKTGPWRLRVEYSGQGMDGSEGRDWMGILLLAPDELRMSVQTAFYPQLAPDPGGPGVARSAATLRARVPDGFEVHAPGRPLGRLPAPGGGVEWAFESESPTVLSLFAAPRVRREVERDGARVVSLLREEHAHLAEPIAATAQRALARFSAAWGPVGAGAVGFCETTSRGGSYNWASQGIVALDRGALRAGVPARTLAHEVAHLWWGQEVVPNGPGERFLTESLAEYAAWRFLEAQGEASALEDALAGARDQWWGAVHGRGADPALADVTFATPDYQALAYAKGPLALWALDRRLGRAAMDDVLRGYRAASRAGPGGLAALAAALGARGLALDEALPWLTRPGHAHLALEVTGAAHEASGAGLQVALASRACPAGCASLVPAAVALDLRWPGGARSTTSVTPGPGGLTIEPRDGRSPTLVESDPAGHLLGATRHRSYHGPALLRALDPEAGATGVPLGPVRARLEFTAPLAPLEPEAVARIQRATDRAAGEEGRRSVQVRGARLEDEGRSVVVEFEGTFPATAHVLATGDALQDADRVPLPEVRVPFTTAPGDEAGRPSVVESVPARGARDVPPGTREVLVVFSEPMRRQSGFRKQRIRELEQAGHTYPEVAGQRWVDERTFVLVLAGPLAAGRSYALPFDERFLDLDGQPLLPYELVFSAGRD